MTNTSLANKLELHYWSSIEDKTHTMDAVVKNKCEHELLQIVSTISKEFYRQGTPHTNRLSI